MVDSIERSIKECWIAVAIVVVLAAGCGSTGDADPGDADAAAPITRIDDGDPVRGGHLVYGLEAETNGWDPIESNFAASGHLVARAVFDPLMVTDAQGEPQPFLLDSAEPADDFRSWALRLRPGVRFHDGTPLDAAALVDVLEAYRSAPRSAPAFAPIEAITAVDDQTVRVDLRTRWVTFDRAALVGLYVPAPAMLTDDGAAGHPVGTGPFVFDEWVPDDHWTGVANTEYWVDGLPYLDEIEFRPIPDPASRVAALQAGDVDMIQASTVDEIARLRADEQLDVVEDRGEPAEVFVMLALDHGPTADIDLRRALAMATDRDAIVGALGDGVLQAADGMYPEGSPWRSDEAAARYPRADPAAAAAAVTAYEAEHGPVRLELGAPESAGSIELAQLVAAQWDQAGVEVDVVTLEQSAYLVQVISGDYDAVVWRLFSGADPDREYTWLHSSFADPEAGMSLNFARLRDPEVDAALDAGRATADLDERRAAYATVQERLSAQLPFLWAFHAAWITAARQPVGGIEGEVPGLGVAEPVDNGRHAVGQLFLAG